MDFAWHHCAFEQLVVDSRGTHPLSLGPIEAPAHAFLAALLSKTLEPASRLWILGGSARHRERLAMELHGWQIDAVTLPDPPLEDFETQLADPERDAERLTAFQRLREYPRDGSSAVALASADAFAHSAPSPEEFVASILSLQVGGQHDPDELQKTLLAAGLEEVTQVHARQQFACRGAILDIFPVQAPAPLRFEFFDRELESLREFDLDSQISIRRLDHAELVLTPPSLDLHLADWFRDGDTVLALDEGIEDADIVFTDDPTGNESNLEAYGTPFAHFDAGDFILHEAQQSTVFHHINDWLASGWTVCIAAATKGERDRFHELSGTHLPAGGYHFLDLAIPEGFVLRSAKLAILSLAELLGRYQATVRPPRLQHLEKARSHSAATELDQLNEDDLIVHADYGIGRYRGLSRDEEGEEELSIEYRDGSTLHVPIDQSHLVSRYVGGGGKSPLLSRLGDGRWSKVRRSAEAAIMDYAARLLRTHAERDSQRGHAHPTDTKWMWEFENSFPFTETPDQIRAISETRADMESEQPMDRLICGDVGFGKTEVAIRAAFKAVTGGSQVAILVPTTVLAEQHWRTFRERMSEFPIRIELLSRFRKPSEIAETIEGIANGGVDIVIGTHRLLSGDVSFQNLGLAIVDEEQRFGVKHKEQFKERFRQIDLLTLSATPIPRTLYFSLMGVRDMSTIDTPPPNRIPVHTSVCAYDERMIRDSVRRELEREGQVFFLHNRVQSIEMVRKRLQELVPEARILVGHGQMGRDDLEEVMHAFVDGKADVLLSTTIIESGIDIPNANTILIDRADRFGLADLYQLRGRVGRATRRAYAILMLPRDQISTGDAKKRVNAIKQYTALGSGFRIAMRDLEIRGAGNLLGTRQSGHIAAVGFDLYCQLLRQSVEQLSGRKVQRRTDIVLRADFLAFSESRYEGSEKEQLPVYIPAGYIADSKARLAAYRELASLAGQDELRSYEERLRDRFGRIPAPARNLIQVSRLRLEAAAAGAEMVEIRGERLMVQRNGGYLMLDNRHFPRLRSRDANSMLSEAVEWLESLNRP